METQHFEGLCRILEGISNLLGSVPPEPPWGTHQPTKAIVQKFVQSGGAHIPQPYRGAFVEPLLRELDAVLTCYDSAPQRLEAFTGAVYQHGRDYPTSQGYPFARPLYRLLAVVSDFYQSSLENTKRNATDIRMRERLPPLATFSYSGKTPFTIPVDDVHTTIGGSAAVVSLPAAFAQHPLLWGLTAHETGGHDVVHAIPGLLDELRAGVRELFAGRSVLGLWPGDLSALWARWMDEAAADVYGVLNMGPMFGPLLAAYIGAVREKLDKTLPPFKVDMVSANGDVHPIDILRIHLVLGAVESLSRLAEAQLQHYVEDLHDLAELCRSGDAVRISGYPLWHGRPVTAVMPLAEMQDSARRVGQYIARAELKALGGRCIQAIETWGSDDEAAAAAVRDALARGSAIEVPPHGADPGRTGQVFAGAIMHLLQAPSKDNYDAIGRAVASALDTRVSSNALWQTAESI